eukprot:TRINITY_DN72961_c0_g1_i1.p3 TRINITY_DN72961_c0_g1~~TRINITY_DN72961_c0_g1_i1.p3  ORF type:complete len:197 (+),score=69.87 TRINITY_DN72961_c0_g1_i1:25-591(+)
MSDTIIDERERQIGAKTVKEFLVKWANGDADSWESAADVEGAMPEAIEAYEKAKESVAKVDDCSTEELTQQVAQLEVEAEKKQEQLQQLKESAAQPREIIVYTSNMTGNDSVRRDTLRMRQVLDARKIKYEVRDVTYEGMDAERAAMRERAKTPKLPQLHVDGVFKGLWDAVEEANECGTILQLLGMK